MGIGTRISAARKAKGLSQIALAEILSVSAEAVSKGENDQYAPAAQRRERSIAEKDKLCCRFSDPLPRHAADKRDPEFPASERYRHEEEELCRSEDAARSCFTATPKTIALMGTTHSMRQIERTFLKKGEEIMKMTSAEANKMVKQLRDQIHLLRRQEASVLFFIAATTENVEDVRPAYSYEETAARYGELEEKIRRIKHALNVFNATTIPEGTDMTIDEILVFLPQATERLSMLTAMLSRPPKLRAADTGRTSIIEYEYLNYDPVAVQKNYDALLEYKNRAMTALDVTNNTVPFEVDL